MLFCIENWHYNRLNRFIDKKKYLEDLEAHEFLEIFIRWESLLWNFLCLFFCPRLKAWPVQAMIGTDWEKCFNISKMEQPLQLG